MPSFAVALRVRVPVVVAAAALVWGGAAVTSSEAAHAATHRISAAALGGLIPEPGTLAPAVPAASSSAAFGAHTLRPSTLPATVDLSSWARPAGDQGRLGSCVSWAAGYSMLGWYANRQALTGAPFAPMYAYSQIQATHNFRDDGSTITEVMTILAGQGIDTRADYVPQGDYDFQTQPTPAQRLNAAGHRGSSWHLVYSTAPSPAGPNAQGVIETELAAGNPVVIGLTAYDSMSFVVASHPYYDVADISGASGGHAVLALGYDSTGVLVENSWGPGWGANGFAVLSWAYIAQQSFVAAVMPAGLSPAAATAPIVTSVTPASGAIAGGTAVTVTGSGFTGATSVRFGANPVAFSVVGPGQLSAVSPPGAGTTDITVTTAAGTSATSVADQFTYVAAPTVTGLAPVSGPAAGGTLVTLTGSSLGNTTAVTIGGAMAAYQISSPSTLLVTTPAGVPGPADVRVTNAAGTSAAGVVSFHYTGPPVVTAVAPQVGPLTGHTLVTLTGTGFTGATAVAFGGMPALTFTVLSDTRIAAMTPASAVEGTVDVAVTTPVPGGAPPAVTPSSVTFAYAIPPTLLGGSRTAGPVAGGGTLVLTGTGFTPDLTVMFGISAATVVSVDSAQRATVVVPRHAAGVVTVTLATAKGTATLAAPYTYVAAPVVSTITPARGTVTGGAWVTVRGANLRGATVRFGASAARGVVMVSGGTLRVRTPAHATGRVWVTVTTAGGRARIAFTFARGR